MKEKRPGKIDLKTDGAGVPLQADPFSALQGLDAAALRPPPPEPEPAEAPPSAEAAPAKPRGRVILRRETKNRGGKTVVVISGFPGAGALPAPALEELARGLRKQLGCGGSVDGREIVVQGDRPAAVAEALRKMNFSVGGVIC